MKRAAALLLIAALLLCLCGCMQEQDTDIEVPLDFCYLRLQNPDSLNHGRTDSVISAQIVEGKDHQNDLDYLLQLYFRGPTDPGLESPFPSGTTLLNWNLTDGTLSLTLSDSLGELTGIDLTLACACLTVTCLSLTDADTVQIQAETVQLDGKESITMDKNILVLFDDSATIPTESEG